MADRQMWFIITSRRDNLTLVMKISDPVIFLTLYFSPLNIEFFRAILATMEAIVESDSG